MGKIPGVNFLRTHPQMELDCGLDIDHVIVDKKDYHEALLLLSKNRSYFEKPKKQNESWMRKHLDQQPINELGTISQILEKSSEISNRHCERGCKLGHPTNKDWNLCQECPYMINLEL